MIETRIRTGPRYRGSYFAAIVKYNGTYVVKAGFGRQGLDEGLASERKSFGESFEVVRIYEEINCPGIIKAAEAARDLQAGKEVDLESILW